VSILVHPLGPRPQLLTVDALLARCEADAAPVVRTAARLATWRAHRWAEVDARIAEVEGAPFLDTRTPRPLPRPGLTETDLLRALLAADEPLLAQAVADDRSEAFDEQRNRWRGLRPLNLASVEHVGGPWADRWALRLAADERPVDRSALVGAALDAVEAAHIAEWSLEYEEGLVTRAEAVHRIGGAHRDGRTPRLPRCPPGYVDAHGLLATLSDAIDQGAAVVLVGERGSGRTALMRAWAWAHPSRATAPGVARRIAGPAGSQVVRMVTGNTRQRRPLPEPITDPLTGFVSTWEEAAACWVVDDPDSAAELHTMIAGTPDAQVVLAMTPHELDSALQRVPSLRDCSFVRIPKPRRWERAAQVLAFTRSTEFAQVLGRAPSRRFLQHILAGLQVSACEDALMDTWWTPEAFAVRRDQRPDGKRILISTVRKVLDGKVDRLSARHLEALEAVLGDPSDMGRFVEVARGMGFGD